MPKLNDLTGQKFGRLTAIKYVGKSKWLCKCDCGNEKVIMASHLVGGHTQSCGCICKEGNHKTHGCTGTRLYRIWQAMKRRCLNNNAFAYELYGGRGISVCDEWVNDYPAFRSWALENGYADNLTIDRIDGSKGYSPNNCRWATREEQSINRSVNRFVTYNGETKTVSEWAKELGINYQTLHSRLTTLGWSVEKSLCK